MLPNVKTGTKKTVLPIHTVTPAVAISFSGRRADGTSYRYDRAPDWKVRTIELTDDPSYPFFVCGDMPKDSYFPRFSWFAPDIYDNPRYDFSGAVFVSREDSQNVF